MARGSYKIYRNVCPRNCYGTCGMLSYVQDGKLIKVEGDPKQGYTKGRLCSKGYVYPEYVYHPQRLRFPLRQYPRGSGNWHRISWEEALIHISSKILELNSRYGSNLALSYNKFSGNLGMLHYAVEGMFNGFGPHTKPVGNPCLSAGGDALVYDYGKVATPDPESMSEADLIVIWGVNPAWTSVHQLHFIQKAKERGAVVVVIDPLFTPTAAKADLYLQIQPGTDGLLALAILKILYEKGKLDPIIQKDFIMGWEPFKAYLQEKIEIQEAADILGIDPEGIRDLAALFESRFPIANWVGFGMQRHANGGQTVRTINALTALTGNLGAKGGGLFYYCPLEPYFPQALSTLSGSDSNRLIDINHFTREAIALKDPPLKFLWVASRNPLSQDPELKLWDKLINQLELMVTVDLFMTQTAEKSDIVLPATSHFEELDFNVGYWHRWLGINERAIEPFYEAKSDLQIARELTAKLNQLSPGFSTFPSELTPEDWLDKEFTPEVLDLFGLTSWEDLRESPHKSKVGLNPWKDLKFDTPSQKFSLFNIEGKEANLPAMPRYKSLMPPSKYPLRLITPQHLSRIHSQYKKLTSLSSEYESEYIEIHPDTAAQREITDGDLVSVYNDAGSCLIRARINSLIPPNVVMTYQGGFHPINSVIPHLCTDMGEKSQGKSGVAFYDVFVDIEKSRGDTHG
jgi:anaerobic selenocysteine-containing dehydrogenase